MNPSKEFTTRSFVLVLISYFGITNLCASSSTIVAALDSPVVKDVSDSFRPKLQAIPEWKVNANRTHFQAFSPSKQQKKNGTDVMSDDTNKPAELTIESRPGRILTSFTTLLHQKFFHQFLDRLMNRLDEIDKMILRNTLPLVGITAIVPILQSLDLFWVNQLGDTLAVSAQSAANTLYQFSFGVISFLPSVTATLVSRSFGKNDPEETESIVTTALWFGATASSIISLALFMNPSKYLGAILKDGSPALGLSMKYMRIRCLSLIPQMVTYASFATFRGMLDFDMCIRISLIASGFDIVLKPVLIHLFRLGILGSASSTLLCDCFTAVCFVRLLKTKGVFGWKKLFKFPAWNEVSPFLQGSTLQVRSFAMHLTNLIVARKVQSFDDSGVFPAVFSLAMQTFFTGGIMIYALAMSAQTLYPNAVAKCRDNDKKLYKKALIKRFIGRGFGVGTLIGCIQALLFPIILRTTPSMEVRKNAVFPLFIAILFQGINGINSIGEAIMVGNGRFASASLILVLASIGYTGFLHLFPKSWGINGVSCSFGIFNLLRTIGFVAFLPSLINQ